MDYYPYYRFVYKIIKPFLGDVDEESSEYKGRYFIWTASHVAVFFHYFITKLGHLLQYFFRVFRLNQFIKYWLYNSKEMGYFVWCTIMNIKFFIDSLKDISKFN